MSTVTDVLPTYRWHSPVHMLGGPSGRGLLALHNSHYMFGHMFFNDVEYSRLQVSELRRLQLLELILHHSASIPSPVPVRMIRSRDD
jgi:hypothetical protein